MHESYANVAWYMQIHLLTALDEYDEVAFKRSFSDLISFATTCAILQKNALHFFLLWRDHLMTTSE